MAGSSSPEDSEPLFVLEPLPELSGVIDSFAAANPIFLLVAGAAIYLLTNYEDPLKKLWTTSLGAIDSILCYRFDVLFDDFYQRLHSRIFVVWGAIRWDELKALLGMTVHGLSRLYHSLSVHGFWLY